MSRLEAGFWGAYLYEFSPDVRDSIVEKVSSYEDLIRLLRVVDLGESNKRGEIIFEVNLDERKYITEEEAREEAKKRGYIGDTE